MAEFQAQAHPYAPQVDALIKGLDELPPTVIDWIWVLTLIARRPQLDLAAAYRRIVPLVPAREAARFYWVAARRLTARGLRDLLPEVAEGFRQLGENGWDPTALRLLQDSLLEAHHDAETLQLAEHSLPRVRAFVHTWGTRRPLLLQCVRILQLRIGRLLRQEPGEEMSREAVRTCVSRDLTEQDVEPRLLEAIVEAVWQPKAQVPWRREDFRLSAGNGQGDEQDMAQVRHVHTMLVHVAREAWEHERFPPGVALHAVTQLLETAWDDRARRRVRGRPAPRTPDTLLDYLTTANRLDERIALSCQEQHEVNLALARITIEGHEILLRFAQRHGLVSETEAAATRTELARLRSVTDMRMREDEHSVAAQTEALL